MFELSIKMVENGVRKGIFPSAALAIGVRDKVLARKTWGNTCIDPPFSAVNSQTLYDMASLSKIIGTSMVAFHMIESGKLSLYDHLADFFSVPKEKENITILHLMTHTSGIAAHFLLSEETADPKDAAQAVLEYPLAGPVGGQTIYSCMGYILLGKILEKIGDAPLDEMAGKYVFRPLGMVRTCYCPSGLAACTERDPVTGRYLCGVVHDENARFLGGVSGNAGVFSTLDDMTRFASMLACGGTIGSKTVLSPPMMAAATKNYTQDFSQNRGLGFLLAGKGEFMGDLFSRESFGHTGFTGTSLAVDPTNGLFVVLLTNRVHPTRKNSRIIRFRRLLHNRIASEFFSVPSP